MSQQKELNESWSNPVRQANVLQMTAMLDESEAGALAYSYFFKRTWLSDGTAPQELADLKKLKLERKESEEQRGKSQPLELSSIRKTQQQILQGHGIQVEASGAIVCAAEDEQTHRKIIERVWQGTGYSSSDPPRVYKWIEPIPNLPTSQLIRFGQYVLGDEELIAGLASGTDAAALAENFLEEQYGALVDRQALEKPRAAALQQAGIVKLNTILAPLNITTLPDGTPICSSEQADQCAAIIDRVRSRVTAQERSRTKLLVHTSVSVGKPKIEPTSKASAEEETASQEQSHGSTSVPTNSATVGGKEISDPKLLAAFADDSEAAVAAFMIYCADDLGLTKLTSDDLRRVRSFAKTQALDRDPKNSRPVQQELLKRWGMRTNDEGSIECSQKDVDAVKAHINNLLDRKSPSEQLKTRVYVMLQQL